MGNEGPEGAEDFSPGCQPGDSVADNDIEPGVERGKGHPSPSLFPGSPPSLFPPIPALTRRAKILGPFGAAGEI